MDARRTLDHQLLEAAHHRRRVGAAHIFQVVGSSAARRINASRVNDARILQVITIAHKTFGKLGISSINRKCTGQILGAGAASAHYANEGGHAVDFYSLGGPLPPAPTPTPSSSSKHSTQ